MNDTDILSRANWLMKHHGLQGWAVRLDHARRRAGCCYHHSRTISLSRVLLRDYPPGAVDDVILHEIAHALVGAKRGHDQVWKATASRIGANPRASLSGELPTPEAPWIGTCPRCGAERRLYRAPRRVVACGACSGTFDTGLILRWHLRGQPTIPGGAYAKELARLRRLAT